MPRQWQSTGLLVLAAALAVASTSAADEWDEFHITINPASPTDKDTFDLRAWHWFTDSGYLRLDQSINVNGNQIDVRALIQDQHTRPDSAFLTVMTPEGAFFNNFGPLAAGTYRVNAEIWLMRWPATSGGTLYDEGTLQFTVTSTGASQPLPGDFNGDSVVDAGDYVAWRNAPGLPQNDYEMWRAHFGQTAGSGADTMADLSSRVDVPEPAMLEMLILFGVAMASPCRWRLPRTIRR